MTMHQTIDPAAAPARATRVQFMEADDKDMLRAARDLTKGLGEAKPGIYWPDMLLSAGIGYAGIAVTILSGSLAVQIVAGLVAALALYRALMFIHELTHIHRDALPGFRTWWNLLVGIPLLTPSFMYEGVHTIHHKRTQYGTPEDPEYLPLALMKPWSLPLFVIVAILAPVALVVRAAVLVPLGALIPAVRRFTWERFSALSINPDFRRRPPEGDFAKRVRWQEAGVFVWSGR
jgi:Fatty acid desaturase